MNNKRKVFFKELKQLMERSAWEAFLASLATLLFAGYEYSHIVPALESLGVADLSILRHACHVAVGVALPIAVWSAMCLTSRSFGVGNEESDGIRR